MAKVIMVQGTASDSGKSFITAGLCRIFADDGYKVAPFKAQNMALNSLITDDGDEIAKSIGMQAACARVKPEVRMNPVLLKPVYKGGSQVVVDGKNQGIMMSEEINDYKTQLREKIRTSFESLSNDYDIIVLEGAGSPAEINLKQNDIVNMGMAKLAKSPVILVGDIDRGGVFAAIAGTMLLFEDWEKDLVKGVVINKFRGEGKHLESGLIMLEDIIKKPVLGVVPYGTVDLEKEDSLSQKSRMKENARLTIGVIKLPRMTNFTEYDSLLINEDVSLLFIDNPKEVSSCDLIILPGSADPLSDLGWLGQTGIGVAVKEYFNAGGDLVGIGEGYALLGTSTQHPEGKLAGLGAAPIVTELNGFSLPEKGPRNLESGSRLLAGETGLEFMATAPNTQLLFKETGNMPENLLGVPYHGIFESKKIVSVILRNLLKAKGFNEQVAEKNINDYYEQQYVELAKVLRESLDMEKIYEILNTGTEEV